MELTGHDDSERRTMLLDAWVEKRQAIARLEAEASALLAERVQILDEDVRQAPFQRDAIHRSMVAEYSAAGHLSKGSVEYAFADAQLLRSEHSAVRESFQRGAISAAHVREILRAGAIVRDAVRSGRVDAGTLNLYDTAAIVVAEQEPPARTRAHVRQIATALAGEALLERHTRASAERCVTVRPVDDGLALLMVVIPEHLAVAIHDRLTHLARQVITARDDQEPALDPDLLDAGPDPVYLHDLLPDDPHRDDPFLIGMQRVAVRSSGEHGEPTAIFGEGDTFTTDPLAGMVDPLVDPIGSADVEHVPTDTRTLDQVRADLLTDLLLASDPSAAHGSGLDNITARIQVTLSASTLAGADDRAAELDGHGPLHPDIARALAGRHTGWSRLFLDPTGMVVETDTYTPTEGMRRHLRARDQHCRFPGCRTPVHRCQIDHNHDHAKGGRTTIGNLSHFCPGHHVLKHPDIDERHRWTARARPDGSIRWTSPIGRTYIDRPPRRVMFV